MNDDNVKCVICCDLDNNDLEMISCEVCKFISCEKCYSKLESNVCPKCKHPHYKTYHPETVSRDEHELFIDMYNQIHDQIHSDYENRCLVLMSIILNLKDKLKSRDKEISNFKKKRIVCMCGKEVSLMSYEKHCNSKRHTEYCDKNNITQINPFV